MFSAIDSKTGLSITALHITSEGAQPIENERESPYSEALCEVAPVAQLDRASVFGKSPHRLQNTLFTASAGI